jgi:hypothetical protein
MVPHGSQIYFPNPQTTGSDAGLWRPASHIFCVGHEPKPGAKLACPKRQAKLLTVIGADAHLPFRLLMDQRDSSLLVEIKRVVRGRLGSLSEGDIYRCAELVLRMFCLGYYDFPVQEPTLLAWSTYGLNPNGVAIVFTVCPPTSLEMFLSLLPQIPGQMLTLLGTGPHGQGVRLWGSPDSVLQLLAMLKAYQAGAGVQHPELEVMSLLRE